MLIPKKFLPALLCLGMALPALSGDRAEPVKGILDLRDYKFNDQAYIRLDGTWDFYWEQFVPPQAFRHKRSPAPTLYGEVPSYWTSYGNPEHPFPGKGYASYHLRILLPAGFHGDIGFDVPVFDAAVRMYLDGQEILSSGRPGTSESTSEAGYSPAILVYRPLSDTLDILLHVSNFQHRRGGFWKSMQIGAPWKIIQTRAKYRLVAYIALGILISFSLFFFFFYIFYRKDRVILTFSIILAGIFIRMLNTDLFPVKYVLNLPWIWIVRLEYLGTFMAMGAALWYFYRLFPAVYMLWLTRINTLLVILSVLVVLIFRADVFAYTMFYLEPAAVLLLLYYTLACAGSIFRGKRENVFFLAGMVIFIAALLNDILVANSMKALTDQYILHFALMLFVFIQAVLIIRSWVRAFTDKEKLMEEIAFMNKNLENLVDRRTLELSRRNRELNEALDFKNRLFSIIAHDLKSPVASLVQNTALLDYDLSKEENRKLVDSFREMSSSALALIDNLLYWGRSQGNQLICNPELFDSAPVIGRVLKLYRTTADHKRIRLDKKSEGGTMVYADRELLEIVFRNLLSNALKFTDVGGIVQLRTETDESAGEIRFTLRDTGIGIPEGKLAGILGGRELISTSGTEQEKGTGLGLRLCHDLVKINHGSMQIESREGEGTRVVIILPSAAGKGEPPAFGGHSTS